MTKDFCTSHPPLRILNPPTPPLQKGGTGGFRTTR